MTNEAPEPSELGPPIDIEGNVTEDGTLIVKIRSENALILVKTADEATQAELDMLFAVAPAGVEAILAKLGEQEATDGE